MHIANANVMVNQLQFFAYTPQCFTLHTRLGMESVSAWRLSSSQWQTYNTRKNNDNNTVEARDKNGDAMIHSPTPLVRTVDLNE